MSKEFKSKDPKDDQLTLKEGGTCDKRSKGSSKPGKRGNGKQGKSGKRGSSKDKEGDFANPGRGTMSRINDVRWYAKTPQLLRDAASYSFNNALGASLPTYSNSATISGKTVTLKQSRMYIPGIMQLKFFPTIGEATSYQSAINISAQNLYTYIRHANSGRKNYDAPDLMLYLLALDSAYMFWNYGKRAYGEAMKFSQQNYYIPRVELLASGFNNVDVQNHLSDFRLYLNTVCAKLKSFAIPNTMPIFLRHSWMVSNIFKDASVAKAQEYIFTPTLVYRYEELSGKGQLVPMPVGAALTVDNYITLMDSLINSLIYSEDIGTMSGDILKAYGEGNLFKMDYVSEDYTIEAAYNETVLEQIHNASLLYGIRGDFIPANITQTDDGNITQVVNIASPTQATICDTISRPLNIRFDVPTPEDVMESTRLMVIAQWNSTTSKMEYAYGTEIITAADVWSLEYTSSGVKPSTMRLSPFFFKDNSVPGDYIDDATVLQNFDWAPIVPYIEDTVTDTTVVYAISGYAGDLSNYTTLGYNDVLKLHTTAVMSEFDVPSNIG